MNSGNTHGKMLNNISCQSNTSRIMLSSTKTGSLRKKNAIKNKLKGSLNTKNNSSKTDLKSQHNNNNKLCKNQNLTNDNSKMVFKKEEIPKTTNCQPLFSQSVVLNSRIPETSNDDYPVMTQTSPYDEKITQIRYPKQPFLANYHSSLLQNQADTWNCSANFNYQQTDTNSTANFNVPINNGLRFSNHINYNMKKEFKNGKQNLSKSYDATQNFNNPPFHSSVNQQRLKSHQNFSNLTYVIPDKENVPKTEKKNQRHEGSFSTQLVTNSKNLNILKSSNKFDLNTKLSSEENITTKPNEDNECINSKHVTENPQLSSSWENYERVRPSMQQQFQLVTPIFSNILLTSPPENEMFFPSFNCTFIHQNFSYIQPNPHMDYYNPNKFLHHSDSTPHMFLNENTPHLPTRRPQKKYVYGKKQWHPSLKSYNNINENTPPDRFLLKSHQMEIKMPPKNLISNSKWDNLSVDIWDKFLINQQKEVTYRKKIFLWKFLYQTIKKNFPRFGLYLVGSTITGFGTNFSDVDMCLVHRASLQFDSRYEALHHLNNLKEFLQSLRIFEKFHLIEARVPILRFCDPNNSFEIDLNFNNSVGIRNTHLLYCYSQLDWRLRPLVLITKLWARYHNINNAKTMTISSYSLALMVIHFLQYGVRPPVLPCLHEMYPEKFNIILTSNEFGFVDMIEEIKPYESTNSKSLGELFLLFLEYYSIFDYSTNAISVRTGKVLPIETCRNAPSVKNDIHQWKELCIEEPFDLTNTARSVYDGETFDKIKHIFSASCEILRDTLDLNMIFTTLKTGTS